MIDDEGAHLIVNWLPGETADSLDRSLLVSPRSTILAALRQRLPERLLRSLCGEVGVDPAATIGSLPRDKRQALVRAIVECPVPVTGDRGFAHAEVTAGGVPLRELHLDTMESRITPRLHIIGEICDVDGRIGGYNFQWAWASGHVAGVATGANR